MTTNATGDATEKLAANALRHVYGAESVAIADERGRGDPFGFVDILAVREEFPVRFVQAKTNGFEKADRAEYAGTVCRFPNEIRCEVWVRDAGVGWRIYLYDPTVGNSWRLELETDTTDAEATATALRKHELERALRRYDDGDVVTIPALREEGYLNQDETIGAVEALCSDGTLIDRGEDGYEVVR